MTTLFSMNQSQTFLLALSRQAITFSHLLAFASMDVNSFIKCQLCSQPSFMCWGLSGEQNKYLPSRTSSSSQGGAPL